MLLSAKLTPGHIRNVLLPCKLDLAASAASFNRALGSHRAFIAYFLGKFSPVGLANILDPEEYKDMSPEARKEQAQTDLRGFLLELEELEREHPEHKLLIRDIIKMTHSYWDGLFVCFANPLIPRANNDLEQFFRALKSGHRRVTGRMSWNDYIIRIGEFAVFDLRQDVSKVS